MLTKTDIKQIDNVVSKGIKKEISPIKKDIRTLKSDVSEIRRDIKTLINYFDRKYLEIRARVERIEEHLNLEQISP